MKKKFQKAKTIQIHYPGWKKVKLTLLRSMKNLKRLKRSTEKKEVRALKSKNPKEMLMS